VERAVRKRNSRKDEKAEFRIIALQLLNLT
jgi:hypothetical protein